MRNCLQYCSSFGDSVRPFAMDISVDLFMKALLYGLLAIVCLMLYFLEQWPTPRRFWMIQKLPGPKGTFYFGNAAELKDVSLDDLLIWLTNQLNQYNRIVRMWFLGVSNVYLKEPEDVQVLLNSKQHITKGREYIYISDWLDQGLLTSTGDKWFVRRKLLTPAFHFKILEDNLTVFNKNARIICQKFKDLKGQDVVLESLITLCTLDVIIGTSMGIDIKAQSNSGQDYVKQIKSVSRMITHRSMRPNLFKSWVYMLFSEGRHFWNTVNFLHNFSYKVINQRKQSYRDRTDEEEQHVQPEGKRRRALLDTLLDIERRQPGTFSDRDIREEVDTFMFEGHDTTSAALVFIFFNLAHHPDIQEKVSAELEDIFGGSDREATSSDLHNMVYLDMVIKESLRTHPSVPYISRMIDKDLVLEDGCTIPAPSNVIVPIFNLHRNEKHWTDPDTFNPERFSEQNSRGRHPYAYIPFSAGPRNCIGQKFAMMELKVVVSTVLRHMKVLPVTKQQDIKFMLNLVLRTNKNIYCKFIPR